MFSVITITYNAEGEILPTLASVKDQKFTDYEHIIVDGASSDATISLARNHGVNGIRIISEPDKGLYDAMNKGMHLANGKYILFLNAGDTFTSPSTLKEYADAAVDNPDIIYGDTVIVDKNRNILRPRHLSTPERLTVESFSHGMLICHQAFCVKRSIAPDYNLKYKFSADYDWTIRCIKSTSPEKCVNLKRVVIHYLDDGMTENNKIASLRERFDIMSDHYGRVRAILLHISFIPRAIIRKLTKN